MGKKNKKIYEEQFETPVDIDVFSDDDALDALIKDYLFGTDSKNNKSSQQDDANDVMGRILSKMSKRNNDEKQRKPVEQTYSTPSRNELPLQPTLGISECLNRVVLTDKTGAMSYASTNKYKRVTDFERIDSDVMGKILSDLEVALLIDSTPSAVFRYDEFVRRFKNVMETNTKRFLFIVDEDFNYQPDAHVYCFFNGTGFYNSCSDVVSKLSENYNMADSDIINIFKDLVIYHSTTSFIARDASYEFEDFINSKYNSADKITELIMNDRRTRPCLCEDEDPDLAQIFNFRRLSDLDYVFSALNPIDDDYSACVSPDDESIVTEVFTDMDGNKTIKTTTILDDGTIEETVDKAIETDDNTNSTTEPDSNFKVTTTSVLVEQTTVDMGERGASNDTEPFPKELEVHDTAGDVNDGCVGYRDDVGEQEPQKEIKEDRGRDNGIIDADPETFNLEIEEEEEPVTPTPKVKQPSSGSMVIPVMRG